MIKLSDKYIISYAADYNKQQYTGIMHAQKIGEYYKFLWEIGRKSEQVTCTGIGIFYDNFLIVSRIIGDFSTNKFPGGVGVYIPLGDMRSHSALWAAGFDYPVLGSGIAIGNKKQGADYYFEGLYRVRYFREDHGLTESDLQIKNFGNNSAAGFNGLTPAIDFKNKDTRYQLAWSKKDQVILNGIGLLNSKNLFFARGKPDLDWQLLIYKLVSNENGYCLDGVWATIQQRELGIEKLAPHYF